MYTASGEIAKVGRRQLRPSCAVLQTTRIDLLCARAHSSASSCDTCRFLSWSSLFPTTTTSISDEASDRASPSQFDSASNDRRLVTDMFVRRVGSYRAQRRPTHDVMSKTTTAPHAPR